MRRLERPVWIKSLKSLQRSCLSIQCPHASSGLNLCCSSQVFCFDVKDRSTGKQGQRLKKVEGRLLNTSGFFLSTSFPYFRLCTVLNALTHRRFMVPHQDLCHPPSHCSSHAAAARISLFQTREQKVCKSSKQKKQTRQEQHKK